MKNAHKFIVFTYECICSSIFIIFFFLSVRFFSFLDSIISYACVSLPLLRFYAKYSVFFFFYQYFSALCSKLFLKLTVFLLFLLSLFTSNAHMLIFYKSILVLNLNIPYTYVVCIAICCTQ